MRSRTPVVMPSRPRSLLSALLLVGLLGPGCALLGKPEPRPPADLWEAAERASTAERRASIRMAARAEDERGRGEAGSARTLAEGALRLDSRNPYAYLVLARCEADLGNRGAALAAAAEAQGRFHAEEPWNHAWQDRAARLTDDLKSRPERPPPTRGAAPGRRLDPLLESGE